MSVPQVVKIIPKDDFFTALYAFDYFMKMIVALFTGHYFPVQ